MATTTTFGLDTVFQVGAAVIRVRFSAAPKLTRTDALDPSHYLPRGPVDNAIQKVEAVAADSNAVDLFMSSSLAAGTWMLGVRGLHSAAGDVLSGVTLLAFAAISPFTEPVASGLTNDAADEVLRKNFNPAIAGPNTDAILAAIAAGDQTNWDNAKLALDQCFMSTASSTYLAKRASDRGVDKPTGIGMSDDLFRRLAILVTTKKLTHDGLWRALEIYYGSDAVRGSITCAAEPYALVDGDTLIVEDDTGESVSVTFEAADFKAISAATSVEVVAALNAAFDLRGARMFATTYESPDTGLHYVRVFTGTLGLGGVVRVVGGRAQTQFLFPAVVGKAVIGTTWAVAPTAQGKLRFTFSGGTDPALDLVQIGDLVNVYGPFLAAHQGTYRISSLRVDGSTAPRTIWFEVANISTATSTNTIAATSDLVFFRPNATSQPLASIDQSDASALTAVLPATTQAVNREIGTGAYLHSATPLVLVTDDNDATPLDPFLMPTGGILNPILTMVRDSNGTVTVTTSSAHGLSVGDHILVDNVYASPNTGLDPNGWTGYGDSMREARQRHSMTLLADGRLFVVGGISATGAVVSTTELFDPASGKWTQGPDMSVARYDHRATLLQDGRVLVTGGSNQGGTALASCELYSPVTNLWSTAPALPAARAGHAAVLLGNSAVFVVGGNESITQYEVYQPWTNSWATTGIAQTIGTYPTATLLNDGRVLVAGGRVTVGTTGAYLYNNGGGTWAATAGALPVGVYSHIAVKLNDGRVLVIGGTGDGVAGATSCALYDPNTALWTSAGSLVGPRFAHHAVTLTDGTVLAFGGLHNADVLDTVELYSPAANTWSSSAALTPIVGHLANARARATAAYVPVQKKIHLVGGLTDSGPPGAQFALANIERYPREISGGGLNGLQTVSTLMSTTQFQYTTPGFPYVSVCDGGTVTPLAAPDGGDVLGPFIYDATSGVALTSTSTASIEAVASGSRTDSLDVVDASGFPDEPGYLVFAFGTSRQQGPVRYLGRLSNTTLIIDQAFQFSNDLKSGDAVCLLLEKGPWVPEQPQSVGSFYATASSAGRVAAADTIRDMAAAGIELSIETVYPGDVGLGGAGHGATGTKLSDKVAVWGGDDLDGELETARAS